MKTDTLPERKTRKSNADRIRSMSNEELLEFLLDFEIGDIDYSRTFCDLCEKDCKENGESTDCEGCLKWWLEKDSKDVQGIDYWNNR